jgi:hypothetical protein
MLPGQSRYYRLDLKPEQISNAGVKYTRKDLHHWSPERVFAQSDLYTTKWGYITNTEIERFFFGKLGTEAPAALDISRRSNIRTQMRRPSIRSFRI